MSEVLQALAKANISIEDATALLVSDGHVAFQGSSPGATAMLLSRAASPDRPLLLLTGDSEQAHRLAEDLQFFLGAEHRVLYLAALDTSPYVEVAPDRRVAMERMATLFHLASGLPYSALVTSAPALLRRVAPKAHALEKSRVVRVDTELEQSDLIAALTAGGYARSPLIEDPGTFAVRGGIVDVYPPHSRYPARIEFDDWLVASIKYFDPDDQRTTESATELQIHPVRDTVLDDTTKAVVLRRVRDLCDSANIPTKQVRKLIEELESGRLFYGIDGFLPAFHDSLETVFDFLPANYRPILIDPTAFRRSVETELAHAEEDRDARMKKGNAAFPIESLYMDAADIVARLEHRPPAVFHRVAFVGKPEGEPALANYEYVADDECKQLACIEQTTLVTQLKTLRSVGNVEPLRPVFDAWREWSDHGLRVLFTARTHTQAERLASILSGVGVTVSSAASAYSAESFSSFRPGTSHIVLGDLSEGFVWPSMAVAILTEGELFGSKARRNAGKKRAAKKVSGVFLEDLKELRVGDYVVHPDHGIGIYLGIETKSTMPSALERMDGTRAISFETLAIEYAGGDRLFVPVTRLSQLQKYSSQEGRKPKLDRLGGSTFATKKSKVRTAALALADELLKLYAARMAARRPQLAPTDNTYAEFEATFPFEETPDQARAIEDVLTDLESSHPMDRLVCGDVGFGKTEVAIRAAFRMAMAGHQVAVLCPTTVLAQQHLSNFRNRFEGYPIKVGGLSRFTSSEESDITLAGTKDGSVDVVIGTHRLLSKDVHFKNLGLVVVDEEQRFGVQHKERLKKLRTNVDVLTLSATPIPRTLQLAIGGMRELSLITTAPVDRRAVRTFACHWDDHTIREAIHRELARGGQIFFVYNRVEGLYERAQMLQTLVPQARIVVAHGQMKEGLLERTMTDFIEGSYDILCSTAIIESGLDIPRANTMIVDRADMFGLAQLYQLRGRVGRSRERAYCYLVTPPPSTLTEEARTRIEALERFTELGSGFHVASLDMELRGVGDLLGAEQSGSVALVGFDIFIRMLEEAVAELRGEVVEQEIDPELSFDLEHRIPEEYVADVGLRLSLYKRFAVLDDEDEIADLAAELEDRFGPPPQVVLDFVRVMGLRPRLRHLRALGCEANRSRVTLHLRDDTPLDPRKLIPLVRAPQSPWRITPDMKLTRRFEEDFQGDSVDRVRALFRELASLEKDPS